ncbi:2-dehydropantoate 2-reductase [Cohnella endophytica]|uniref:2-dehydropantoate 2-reductase n=1 Tax=Cohnella endophytica TaxID=2419778 RepID=A0A494Y4N5_9BACL|nr:2-dehydropantoate 2-reductase [Cohnella endophytica]RKP55256.1 2-dehydropantoate 2-reductase [Cohnella endophytica]
MNEIIVLGGGSLGLLLAGRLKASGCDCKLWTRTRVQAESLDRHGLTIQNESGEREERVEIQADPIDSAVTDEQGIVLLAVKQTALTPTLLARLAIAVPIGGTLVLLQNGIGHRELIEQVLPGRKLITAITTEAALRIDTTTVRHTGKGEILLEDETSHRLQSSALKRLLKRAGFSVFLSKQLEAAILRKLLVNAVINPLTAILRIRNGELIETPARLDAMRNLFRETFGLLSVRGLPGDEEELWNAVKRVCAATSGNESSMLQDIRARRETEIDSINGAIIRMAASQGRTAPWNEAVTALVKAVH